MIFLLEAKEIDCKGRIDAVTQPACSGEVAGREGIRGGIADA